jgi:hypothetical protein
MEKVNRRVIIQDSPGINARPKVKHTYSGNTVRNPLNIDFGINNERQDCKIGTLCVGEGEWKR